MAIGAHNLCSGLWVVARVQAISRGDRGAGHAPFAMFGWEPGFTYAVDSVKRTVTVRPATRPPRTAKFNGDQGCAIMPRGESELHFKPVAVPRSLPDASTQRWPMGDLGANATFPDVKADVINAALDWGMAQGSTTRGQSSSLSWQNRRRTVRARLDERHAPDQLVGREEHHRRARGILVDQGLLKLDDPAPIKEWQQPAIRARRFAFAISCT